MPLPYYPEIDRPNIDHFRRVVSSCADILAGRDVGDIHATAGNCPNAASVLVRRADELIAYIRHLESRS